MRQVVESKYSYILLVSILTACSFSGDKNIGGIQRDFPVENLPRPSSDSLSGVVLPMLQGTPQAEELLVYTPAFQLPSAADQKLKGSLRLGPKVKVPNRGVFYRSVFMDVSNEAGETLSAREALRCWDMNQGVAII